ncbi:hypothetical protein Tco_1328638 [Tanacetum coccineum]
MMYGRPPTNPFQNPLRNTTSPFKNYILILEQHQDEYFDDVWTPEKAMEAIENYTPSKIISEQELANLRAQAERLFEDEKFWVELPSSKEFPSVDEPEPQPLPNLPFLDINLGDKRGLEPLIKTHNLGSFRVKVVEPLTIHTPPSPHVAYFHLNGVYRYYHLHLTLSVGETHLLHVK